MRIEATIGPVTLLFERDRQPSPGERFKVAVFVSNRAMGVQAVTFEDWVKFCQAAPMLGTSP